MSVTGHGRHCETPRDARDLPPAPVRAPAGRDRGDPRAPRRVGARGARASRSRCSTATATRRSRPRARRRPRRSPSASRARACARSSSPRCSARTQTAAPLAARTGLEPAVVPELREVSLGEWEGGEFRIRMAEGDPIAIQAVAEERWEVIPGAETMEVARASACAPASRRSSRARGPGRARRGDRARRRDRRDLPPGDRQPPVRVRALRQRLAHAARSCCPAAHGCCARSTTRAHLA